MKKIVFLIFFLLLGPSLLKASDNLGTDEEFVKNLDSIKNPFEDGMPKPVPVVVVPPKIEAQPIVLPKPRPRHRHELPKIQPVEVPVVIPQLNLQGVIVNEDIHEAIINDEVVPLKGFINGAQVNSVNKDGVELSFQGKKIFLKVE
jgi:hypothetical protein